MGPVVNKIAKIVIMNSRKIILGRDITVLLSQMLLVPKQLQRRMLKYVLSLPSGILIR